MYQWVATQMTAGDQAQTVEADDDGVAFAAGDAEEQGNRSHPKLGISSRAALRDGSPVDGYRTRNISGRLPTSPRLRGIDLFRR
jgi:hypothetical protein